MIKTKMNNTFGDYNGLYVYRGDNNTPIVSAAKPDETLLNKYNDKNNYVYNNRTVLSAEMFPELLISGSNVIITNDGLVAIFFKDDKYNADRIVIYDIINEEKTQTNFSNITSINDPNKSQYTTSNNPLNYHWITCKSDSSGKVRFDYEDKYIDNDGIYFFAAVDAVVCSKDSKEGIINLSENGLFHRKTGEKLENTKLCLEKRQYYLFKTSNNIEIGEINYTYTQTIGDDSTTGQSQYTSGDLIPYEVYKENEFLTFEITVKTGNSHFILEVM